MNSDLQRLQPYLDDDTRIAVDQAAETLGALRGYRGPYLHDPTVRLCLLASLQHQLRTDLVETACEARELGYTTDELLTLLTIQPAPR